MEDPIKMDDLGGKPTIFGNTHVDQPPAPTKSPWNLPAFELGDFLCDQAFGLLQHAALLTILFASREKSSPPKDLGPSNGRV